MLCFHILFHSFLFCTKFTFFLSLFKFKRHLKTTNIRYTAPQTAANHCYNSQNERLLTKNYPMANSIFHTNRSTNEKPGKILLSVVQFLFLIFEFVFFFWLLVDLLTFSLFYYFPSIDMQIYFSYFFLFLLRKKRIRAKQIANWSSAFIKRIEKACSIPRGM